MSVQVDVNAMFVELVAKEMVACGETKIVPGFQDQWTIECILYNGANKESAKKGLEKFLHDAWQAYDIKFFVKYGAPKGKFWVRFTSSEY